MTRFVLGHGPHDAPSNGLKPDEFCWNEGVAWIAGEDWSPAPACVDPLVRGLGLRLNDLLNDTDRQRLAPFMLRAIGTASDGRHDERRRAARGWLFREALPEWMDIAGRAKKAEWLRGVPDTLTEEEALRIVRDARHELLDACDEAQARLRYAVRRGLDARGLPGVGVVDALDALVAAYAYALGALDATAVAYANATNATLADVVVYADAATAATAAAVGFAAATAFADNVAPLVNVVISARETDCNVYDAVYDWAHDRFQESGLAGRIEQVRACQIEEVLDLFDRLLPPASTAVTEEMLQRARQIGVVT